MKTHEIRNLTKDELLHNRRVLIEEWFNLRIQATLKPPDNPKRIKQIKKDLSRINTILQEDKLGIRKIIGN
jgi:large subunit ribosomal protein L29